MKRAIFYFFLTIANIAPLAMHAQDNDMVKYDGQPTVNVFRINFFGIPGVAFEHSLGNDFTVNAELGLGWPVITEETGISGYRDLRLESVVNPYILLEARYYYNFRKRAEHGKSIDNFSGNYIAPFYRYNAYEYEGSVYPDEPKYRTALLRDVQYMGIWWGMQRNLGSRQRFYIDWSIGPGIKTNFVDYADFSLSAKFGIGLQW